MNRSLLIYVFLIIATAIAYSRVTSCQFVNYDDQAYVFNNPNVIEGLTINNIRWAFANSHSANWHPLTWISHMLDCQLFGLWPGGHHITSVILHIINTLLLFTILKGMTKAVWQSAFVAAMFALHPLHVESVAWISERKDVLSTMFGLLSIWAYIGYAKRKGDGKYLLSILFLAMSLMSKPTLVTMPFLLLLLDYWPLNRICPLRSHKTDEDAIDINQQLQNANYRQQSIVGLLTEKIPMFIISAQSCVITYIAQKTAGAVDVKYAVPMGLRIVNAIFSYVWYIKKMIWPTDLAVLYLHPYLDGGKPLSWLQISGSIVVLLLISVVIIMARRQKYLVVGWLWYIVTLIPVIGLIRVGMQGMDDRYSYIPLIGIFIIISWGGSYLISKMPSHYFCRRIISVAVVFWVLALMGLSWVQAGYWRDSVSLFSNAIKVDPDNYVMHYYLGGQYQAKGKLKEAIGYYQKAIDINPNFTSLKKKMAWILATYPDPNIRDADKAIELAEKAYQQNEDKIGKNFDIANYVPKVQIGRAIQLPGEVFVPVGEETGYMDTLAAAYAAKGQFDRAIEQAEKALELAKTSGAQDTKMTEDIRKRLNLYREGKPYYDFALSTKDKNTIPDK